MPDVSLASVNVSSMHRLSLANLLVPVQELIATFGKYTGEPCDMMDFSTLPAECQPIMTYLRELYTAKFRLAQEVVILFIWSGHPIAIRS